jgi:hypothetical protein
MKLTPIKVRGKRTTNAPKKRKMADLTIEDAVEPPRKFSKRRAKKCLLEREIPLEIMERFFILSENTNFPLCSPLLGRLLSGRHTLVATVIAAFGPTWEIGFGFKYIEDCWSILGQPTPTGNPVFQVSSSRTTISPSDADLNLLSRQSSSAAGQQSTCFLKLSKNGAAPGCGPDKRCMITCLGWPFQALFPRVSKIWLLGSSNSPILSALALILRIGNFLRLRTCNIWYLPLILDFTYRGRT